MPCVVVKRRIPTEKEYSIVPKEARLAILGCKGHLVAVQVPLSRSGKSGLSVACTPVSDGGYFESGGSGGSRLTANNLTEFDNLQRQVSRKDKPRSPLHGKPLSCLAI